MIKKDRGSRWSRNRFEGKHQMPAFHKFIIDIVSWKVCKPSPGRHKVSCFSSLKFTENKNENIHKSEAQETDEQTSIDK